MDVALIVALVLVVRAATFWSEVIDWDVGLYLVVAREVLHGHLPYVTAWEYRPPGLFFLIAAALGVFRHPAAAMASLGVVAVSATSIALYAIGREFGTAGRTIGLTAAVFYATISIEDDGLATNTEILFAPMLAWAFLIVARAALRGRAIGTARAALVGVLAGFALQMKLMVLPEAAFLVVLAAWWARGGVRAAAAATTLALLPFAVEAAIYAAVGNLADFLDANVYATFRRAGVQTTAPRDNLQRIMAQPLALAPASVLALLTPLVLPRGPGRSRTPALIAMIAAWFGVEALTIVLVREFNDHQFLQLLPPLGLLAAYATAELGARLRALPAVMTLAVVVSFAMHGYYQVVTAARLAYHRDVLHDASWHRETIDRVAERIASAPEGARTLFVVGETPIVYLLAETPLPTRYPFSLYLTDPEMWPLTGVNGPTEVARILSTHPAFILHSDSRFHLDARVDALLTDALGRGYRAIATYGHDTLFARTRSTGRSGR